MSAYSISFLMKASAPPRAAGIQPARTYQIQRDMELSWSWGIQPASAIITYIGDIPVLRGAALDLLLSGHVFYGICKRQVATTSSGGNTWSLEFVDTREFLRYDYVKCAFNMQDVRTVSGARVKRYRHLLPADYRSNKWTYTNQPYTAAEIINFLCGAPTVESPWRCTYHAVQLNRPVYELDFTSGRRLDSAMQEVTEKQGLLMTLKGGRYDLVWDRKGDGPIELFPSNSDNRRIGEALSDNPTRVELLGDPNLYQTLDCVLEKDWKAAWEQFFDVSLLSNWLYQNGKDPRTGIAYKRSEAEDPEQVIGRQKAAARALTITVAEFAGLRDLVSSDGEGFRDYRKFSSRSRLEMPAATYIKAILFRAFRLPETFSINNASGEVVPLSGLTIVGQNLARITHDYATGAMSYDAADSQAPEGNGYAIVQGYQLGSDAFKTFQPERFNINEWLQHTTQTWEHVAFQIDDSGEGEQFILFDEPVIRTEDMLTVVDGYAVLKANPTFTTPPVRAALCFAAERYSFVKGRWGGTRDGLENLPGLHGEYIGYYGKPSSALRELPYADGRTAREKAQEIADYLLERPVIYVEGGYTVKGCNATQLNATRDRVTVRWNASGLTEDVDFSNERTRDTFEPEREFERKVQLAYLFPGQAENRQLAQQHLVLAGALKQNPNFVKTLMLSLHENFGSGLPLRPTVIQNGSGTLPVGTPIWKKPSTRSGDGYVDTVGQMPANVSGQHSEFVGVTTRDNETATSEIFTQNSGIGLARVMGPVDSGDALVRATGQNYLVAQAAGDADAPVAAIALRDHADAAVSLINVRFSGPASGSGSGALGGQGMYLRGELSEDDRYEPQEVVVVRSGASKGTYVNLEPDGPGADVTNGKWLMIAGEDLSATWR